MELKSYSAAIKWMFSQFPSYQNIGAGAYKPGLQQTKELLAALQINLDSEKIIHVAGTNGKGSTCSYMNSILTEKNEKVGLFTSPHIFDFRERIRINGEMINEDSVLQFCQRVHALQLDFEPSFFEISFAMALDHFQRNNCNYLVIETGMGGRLDATNVLQSDISVITNIGLDHTQFLGSTLEEIAKEKAGIMKARRPVIIGQSQLNCADIFRQTAHKNESTILFADQMEQRYPSDLNLPNLQLKNLQTALVTLHCLGMSISEETIRTAVKKVAQNSGLFGRLSQLQEAPKVLLDVSHNADGMKATMEAVTRLNYGELQLIYGASQDKNIREILDLFPDKVQIHLCSFGNERSFSLAQLEALKLVDKRICSINSNVNSILSKLIAEAAEEDLILVTGSFFLLSDLNLQLFNG